MHRLMQKWRKTLPPLGVWLGNNKILLVSGGEKPLFLAKTINDPSEWGRTIASLMDEFQIPRSAFYLVLGHGLYQQVQIDKPNLADEEMMGAIPWAVKDYLSEPVTQMVFDYIDLPTPPAAPKRIGVIAAQKRQIQLLVDVLHHHGEIKEITIDELAICALFQDSARVTMLLLQPHDAELQLLVFYQGGLCFSRQLRGFKALVQPGEPESYLLDSLALELQRSLDYLQGQLKLPPCHSIQLAIASEHLGALVRHLESTFSIGVTAMANKAVLNGIEFLPAFAAISERAE